MKTFEELGETLVEIRDQLKGIHEILRKLEGRFAVSGIPNEGLSGISSSASTRDEDRERDPFPERISSEGEGPLREPSFDSEVSEEAGASIPREQAPVGRPASDEETEISAVEEKGTEEERDEVPPPEASSESEGEMAGVEGEFSSISSEPALSGAETASEPSEDLFELAELPDLDDLLGGTFPEEKAESKEKEPMAGGSSDEVSKDGGLSEEEPMDIPEIDELLGPVESAQKGEARGEENVTTAVDEGDPISVVEAESEGREADVKGKDTETEAAGLIQETVTSPVLAGDGRAAGEMEERFEAGGSGEPAPEEEKPVDDDALAGMLEEFQKSLESAPEEKREEAEKGSAEEKEKFDISVDDFEKILEKDSG